MSNFKSTPLLCVGTVAYDNIKTPFGESKRTLGGSATYFSLAARLFSPVSVVAVVGEDFKDTNIFKNHKIEISGLEVKKGETFSWGGEYSFDLNTRKTLFTNLGVFENFDPALSDQHINSKYVFLANSHPTVQLNVLKQIKLPKLVGLDTMNLWIEKTPKELHAVLKKTNVLLINDSEARELSRETNLAKAAKVILKKMGSRPNRTLIIKKGEHGLILFGQNKIFALPGFPLENIQDPTGAGDSFAGAFMGYLSKTNTVNFDSMKKACLIASCVASFCVEEFGSLALQKLSTAKLNSRITSYNRLLKN